MEAGSTPETSVNSSHTTWPYAPSVQSSLCRVFLQPVLVPCSTSFHAVSSTHFYCTISMLSLFLLFFPHITKFQSVFALQRFALRCLTRANFVTKHVSFDSSPEPELACPKCSEQNRTASHPVKEEKVRKSSCINAVLWCASWEGAAHCRFDDFVAHAVMYVSFACVFRFGQ
jgi:hypothetical protein